MIQRVVTGSSRVNSQVPMGTPTTAPRTITAVALQLAWRHPAGSIGSAPTKSMIRSSAATKRGAAMLLASGMKISAEPKPENPRAVAEMKAIAQIASAVLVLTSAGMRSDSVIHLSAASRFSASCSQDAAGLSSDLGDNLRRHRVDLLVG